MTPYHSVPPVFDLVTAGGMTGIAIAVVNLLAALRARYEGPSAARSTAVVLALWMLATAAAATSGWLARFDLTPPPMAGMIAVIFLVPVAVALSDIGRRMAEAWPVMALVGLQAFRLPLELVMHRAATLGIMPLELSYSGYNLDVLTGASAFVLWLAMRVRPLPTAVVWIWNLWGLGCLGVIAWIARTASPMVRGFGDDPRHVNTWVLYVPYVWLPTVLVMVAIAMHLVLTRKLLTPSSSAPYTPSRS